MITSSITSMSSKVGYERREGTDWLPRRVMTMTTTMTTIDRPDQRNLKRYIKGLVCDRTTP